MKRASQAQNLPKPNDKTLPRVLLDDYQRASMILSQLAVTFRTRESQLRKLAESADSSAYIGSDSAPEKTVEQILAITCFCFGKFRVEVQGVPVKTLGRSNALRVFKFLTQRQRPCASEVLLETIWPESEPKSAANRLRVEIHTLRQLFAASVEIPDIIIYRNGCYELNPEITVLTDAEEFETLWSLGARYEAEGNRQEASQIYEQAACLYVGDYLEEDLYEEWTLFRRESLRDSYLYMLGKLAGWHMEEGNHASCISYSHKMLSQDSYREDAYRLLMNCYSALGQKATALHWYDVCRANLKKGLDITPSVETTGLKNRIMAAQE